MFMAHSTDLVVLFFVNATNPDLKDPATEIRKELTVLNTMSVDIFNPT
jgi:hypothetical protein